MNLIRKILNYSHHKITEEEKHRFCAEIVGLAMYMLEQKGLYNIPNEANIELIDIKSAYFTGRDIKVSKQIFNSYTDFVDDLTTLPHEVCHLAQSRYKDAKKLNTAESFGYTYMHFNSLMYHILKTSFPEKFEISDMVSLRELMKSEGQLSFIYDYFYSYYALQPIEQEAYAFGYEFVEHLFSLASKERLTDEEEYILDGYKQTLEEYMQDYYEGQDFYKILRQDVKSRKRIEAFTSKAFNQFRKENPQFLESLIGMNLKDYEEHYSKQGDTISFLINVLEICYDDEFAHKLLWAIHGSNMLYQKNNFICLIARLTEIELTEDEIFIVKKALKLVNKQNGENINFETLMRDKAYNLALQKALMNGEDGTTV